MGKKRRLKYMDSPLCDYVTVYNYYFDRLSELAMSVFEWVGTEPSVNTEYLERNLYKLGYMLYFNDEILGDLTLKCTACSPFDVYDIPMIRHVYTANGYHALRTNKNSVLIYDNYLHKSLIGDIRIFAKRLTNLQMTIDMNIYAQRTPVIIECPNEQKLTLENAFAEYDGYKPVIKAYSGGILTDGIKVLRLDAPYLADKLEQERVNIWHDALTRLGIANVNTVKKERLIKDEVQRNMGGTYASRWSRLGARKKACEEINAMFTHEIDVVVRDEFQMVDIDDIDSILDNLGGGFNG